MTGGSADQLLGIIAYAASLAAEDEWRRNLACPNDGTPYLTGPAGQLYCPHDGYRPDAVSTG